MGTPRTSGKGRPADPWDEKNALTKEKGILYLSWS